MKLSRNKLLDIKAAAAPSSRIAVCAGCAREKRGFFCLSWQCLYLTHAGLDVLKLPNCVQIFCTFFFMNFMFPLLCFSLPEHG